MDTIKRKRAEEAIQEAEARYRMLVEHVPATTYVGAWDQTSSMLYVSPQIEQMLGFALEVAPRGGFRVTRVRRGSGAHRIGIERGDRILGINGKPLNGEEALRRAVLDLRGRGRALVVVQRGRGRYHVTVPLS